MFTCSPYDRVALPEAHALIESIRLGTLVTTTAGLDASPLPFLVDSDRGPCGTLISHLARANRQVARLQTPEEVLITFTGPQTFVSAEWYHTGPRVSTWYYVAVHVYGRARRIDDPSRVRQILDDSFLAFGGNPQGWQADPAYVERLLPAIAGVEIEIDRIEAQQRLGQESPDIDYRSVREQLLNGSLTQQLVGQRMPAR